MHTLNKALLILSVTIFFFSCRRENVISDPYALPDSYSNKTVGQSANDLLSGIQFSSVNVQVHYMPGYQLEGKAISNVTAYINNLCNKPGGVSITQSQITGNGDTLDPSKVALIEKQNRTAYTAGGTISLYILVTDGYDTAVNTLGVAYRNTSICLFGKNIFDNSGQLGQITRVALETSVLEHEIGHLLGLVDQGSPMQSPHQDVDHGHHCINTSCLMYYSIGLHSGISTLKIPALDSNCLADLKANGGK